MAQLKRKSIGFSDREVVQIEEIRTDETAPALLENVLYGGQAWMPSSRGLESFSDVVRKLALVGLGTVHKEQLAAQYRATAEVAAEYFSDADLTAMAHTALGAIDDLTASKTAVKPDRRSRFTREDDRQKPARVQDLSDSAQAAVEVAESQHAET